MNIAHVLSSVRIGGQERVALDLASGQRDLGHEVLVVSLAPAPDGPLAAAHRPVGEKPFRDLVDDAEREIILRTLAFTRDNATEAARLLDLERGHFYKKMKALGIKRPRAQEPADKVEGAESAPTEDGEPAAS